VKGRWFWVIAYISIFSTALLYVRSRFLVVELSYDINAKRKEKQKLEQLKREYTLELATLQNPGRIEKIAREDLHLKRLKPDETQTYIRKNGTR